MANGGEKGESGKQDPCESGGGGRKHAGGGGGKQMREVKPESEMFYSRDSQYNIFGRSHGKSSI